MSSALTGRSISDVVYCEIKKKNKIGIASRFERPKFTGFMFVREREVKILQEASEDENERESAALQTNQFADEVATAGLSRRGRRDHQSSSHTNAQRRHASLPFAAQSTPDFCLYI